MTVTTDKTKPCPVCGSACVVDERTACMNTACYYVRFRPLSLHNRDAARVNEEVANACAEVAERLLGASNYLKGIHNHLRDAAERLRER